MNQNYDHSQDADSELHQLLSQRPTPEHGPEFWNATQASFVDGAQTVGARSGSISRFGLTATVLSVAAGAGVLLAAFVGAQSTTGGSAISGDPGVPPETVAIETTLEPDEAPETTTGNPSEVVAPDLVVSDVQPGDVVNLETLSTTGVGLEYPIGDQPASGSDLLTEPELVFLRPSGAVLRIRLNQAPTLDEGIFEVSGQDEISSDLEVPVYRDFESQDIRQRWRVAEDKLEAKAVAVIDPEAGTRQTYIFVQHPTHIIEIEIAEPVVTGPTGFDDFLAGLRFNEAVG